MADNDDKTPPADENQIIAERRAKLAAARAHGQAFPNDFRRNVLAGELHGRYGAKSNEELEVLGVEVREFAGANMRALVPRVIGQTERARQDKAPQPTRKTNTAEVIEKSPDWCRAFLQEWFDNATKEGFRVIPGTKGVSIRVPQKDGKFVTLVQVYPPGAFGYAEPHLYVCFPYLAPFETSEVVSQALLKAAPFKVEKDQVKLFLDPTNLRAAGDALRYLWEIGRKILTTPAMAQKTTPKTAIG